MNKIDKIIEYLKKSKDRQGQRYLKYFEGLKLAKSKYIEVIEIDGFITDKEKNIAIRACYDTLQKLHPNITELYPNKFLSKT